jgi:hypothetical protein
MQTFMPYKDPKKSARVLDNKRLGKQRVECVQILNALLENDNNSTWKNHPAVRMWKGYESFLLYYYRCIMNEWLKRGFNNQACERHYERFIDFPQIKLKDYKMPHWLNRDFCISHRSNLLRKNFEHYSIYWRDIPDDIPYIWPTKEEE